MKSMVSLLIRLPKTMPRYFLDINKSYFAGQIYSKNSGMMQKMNMLLSIGCACVESSQLSPIHMETQTQILSVNGEIVPLQKSTNFSSICLYYFNPLMSEIHKWLV